MAFSGWGIFFLVVFILIVVAGVGWIAFTQYRARRLGLPAPSLNPFTHHNRQQYNTGYAAPAPAPGGIGGWFNTQWDKIRGGGRTAGGSYESAGYGGSRGRDRRGFGALDPDEAWDARVGNEAYYEEQELGLQDPQEGPYGGSGYGGGNVGVAGIEEGRGRSRSRQRELDDRYDEEMHGGAANPFGDHAATGDIRGVSPRPMVDTVKIHKSQQSLGATSTDSPTERRSMFRENM